MFRAHDESAAVFGVRGIAQSTFQLSEEWYDAVAKSRPPKDKPWYHVLVDGAQHTTYVAERNLERDGSGEPVEHPLLEELLGRFQGDGSDDLADRI